MEQARTLSIDEGRLNDAEAEDVVQEGYVRAFTRMIGCAKDNARMRQEFLMAVNS